MGFGSDPVFVSSIGSRVLRLVSTFIFVTPTGRIVEVSCSRGHLLLEKTIVVRENLHGAYFALCQFLGMILEGLFD